MSNMEELSKMLREKNQQEKQRVQSIVKDKTEWLRTLDRLFGNIQKWVGQLLKENLVALKKGGTIIDDDGLFGRYSANMLTIQGKGWCITLRPVGRFMAGACGRVDVNCGKIKHILILDKEGWELVDNSKQGSAHKKLDEELFACLIKDAMRGSE